MRRLRQLAHVWRSGGVSLVLRKIATHLYSDELSLGLRLDTARPASVPAPPLTLVVRPMEPGDVATLLAVPGGSADLEATLARATAAHLVQCGVRTCYVAVTRAGRLCYAQFLIDSSQSDKLRELYGDLMPPLQSDEGLLEAALSLEPYRGRGIIFHVIPELARRARARGLNWLIAFAAVTNLPMLRACKEVGFVPYLERRESYRLFRRRVTFRSLTQGTPFRFTPVAG